MKHSFLRLLVLVMMSTLASSAQQASPRVLSNEPYKTLTDVDACLAAHDTEHLRAALRALHSDWKNFNDAMMWLQSALEETPPCTRLFYINLLAGQMGLEKNQWKNSIRYAELQRTRWGAEGSLGVAVMNFLAYEWGGRYDMATLNGSTPVSGGGCNNAHYEMLNWLKTSQRSPDNPLVIRVFRYLRDCEESEGPDAVASRASREQFAKENYPDGYFESGVRGYLQCLDRYPRAGIEECANLVGRPRR